MSRATQFTIGRYIVAVAIIGYLCAYPELAVLLGIFTAALLLVAPVAVISYFACRLSLGTQRRSTSLIQPEVPEHPS